MVAQMGADQSTAIATFLQTSRPWPQAFGPKLLDHRLNIVLTSVDSINLTNNQSNHEFGLQVNLKFQRSAAELVQQSLEIHQTSEQLAIAESMAETSG
jgi:hypothetical protein